MTHRYTLAQLAEIAGGSLRGGANTVITGVGDVMEAGPADVTWVSSGKYAGKLASSRAGAVLVASEFGPTPMPAILCERVDRAVARVLGAFASPVSQVEPGVHGSAVIHARAALAAGVALGPHVVVDEGARIGARTVLHAGVYIGRDAAVGEDCLLWPNVVIRDRCTVGKRVIIHPNAVIGADGFGFYFDEGRHNKVPHIGGVMVEDDVEIGACTCIDRAKFGNTVVGRGTKIDNQVQIAHNVRIGEHCVLAGQTGIGGSARIGRYCVFGGRVAVVDNLSLGEGARSAAQALVTKDVQPGMTVSGIPAQEHRAELRMEAALRRVPELLEQFRSLTARVERLEASAHHST